MRETRPDPVAYCLMMRFLGFAIATVLLTMTAWAKEKETYTYQDQTFYLQDRTAYQMVGQKPIQIASLPHEIKAMFSYYRPKEPVNQITSIHSSIGPTTKSDSKIWFGMSFYEGEGSQGIGGIGFFDMATRSFGLLRHPAIVDVDIAAIEVTEESIHLLTKNRWELTEGVGNGLVSIDRKTGDSTIRLPEKVRFIGNSLTNEERKASQLYQQVGRKSLLELFGDWPATPGPKAIHPWRHLPAGKIETLMYENYLIEKEWIDKAVNKFGRLLYTIRSSLTADSTIIPHHSLDFEELDFMSNVLPILQLRALDLSNYKCTPKAFVDVIPRMFVYNYGTLVLRPANRKANLVGWNENFRILDISSAKPSSPILIKEKFSRIPFLPSRNGLDQAPLVLLKMYLIDNKQTTVNCSHPFERFSGPAFSETSFKLEVQAVDESFVPYDKVWARGNPFARKTQQKP